MGPADGEDLDAWLNAFNQQWVDAARRISPALLTELLDLAGRRFEEHVATLDLDAMSGPVEWATGSKAAPVWLDVGREYMERYVHQLQIRDTTGRSVLGASFTSPVLAIAAHALPRALDGVIRPAGTIATFSAEGEGGGAWHVVRASGSTSIGWELESASFESASLESVLAVGSAACQVRTTVDDAIKLYIRSPGSVAFRWEGDHELAEALFGVKAILG